MILHFLDSKMIGGIETHVETLVRAQNAAGYRAAVVLWQCHDHGQTVERFKRSGLRVIAVGGRLRTLRRVLRELRPEIIHTHGYKGAICGRIVARSLGIPVISTFHAGERGAFPVWLYQLIDEWTSFLGSRIAVSQQIADQMPFKTKVMANFVEVPAARPRSPQDQKISFVGRMSFEKGPDIFGQIARNFADKERFVMYGEGPLMGGLKIKIGGFVRFNGFATNMDLVWQSTELLVMPSRSEGLPMAALEAMARGIPLVAARVGALPQIIEHGVNGFLFDSQDVDGATASIKKWDSLSKAKKLKMSAAARQTVLETYSTVVGIPKVMAAYEEAGWASRGSIISMVQSSSGL